jgi:hypothetical protein
MKDVDGFPWADRDGKIAARARGILYEAVSRALEDSKKVYEDPRKAYEVSMETVKVMLSGIRRGMRKEIEEQVLKPYRQRFSFD